MTYVSAYQGVNTQAFNDALQDLRDSFENITSGGDIPIADVTTLVESTHDLFDNLVQKIFDAFPESTLNGAALTRTLFLGNAAVAAVLEGLEVGAAYAAGESVGQQLAGALGAVLGGGIGGYLGLALGASVGAFIGAPILAGALAIGLGIIGAGILGGFLENYYENLYSEISEWFEDAPLPEWIEDLSLLFNPPPKDPLVIDLDGDGVELTSLDGSDAFFDLDGDGIAENTAWVAPDDGLLAIDANGNGMIDDITELFGSDTETGFEQLAAFDTNGDGVVNSDDAEFASLSIWQDANGNGVTDAGELQSLTDAGIASISLNATATDTVINGNQVIETSTVTHTDGSTTDVGEVLFEISQVNSTTTIDVPVSAAIKALPFLKGFGDVLNLDQAMATDEDGDLQVRVENLMAIAKDGNFTAFENDFDMFMADWANTEDSVWISDIENLSVRFLYKLEDLDPDWEPGADVNSPGGGANPTVSGFMFIDGTNFDYVSGEVAGNRGLHNQIEFSDPEAFAWLEATGLVGPNSDLVGTSWQALSGTIITPLPVTVVKSGGGGGSVSYTLPNLDVNDATEELDSPDMSAIEFATLQKLLGQEYSQAANFYAPENIIVPSPSDDVFIELMQSYQDLKSYMMAKFLVESAWSVRLEEGPDADIGALAPFENLFVDPFEDRIKGDASDFATGLIDQYRADSTKTDADALHMLGHFVEDIPYLGALVADHYPDIDRALIAEHLEFGTLVEGAATDDTITSDQKAALVGHDGDDTLVSSGDEKVFLGGAGDDTLSGSNAKDIYVYREGDGNDVIIDPGGTFGANVGDTLVFVDLKLTDVTFTQNADQDLVITAPDGGTVTITNHFASEYSELDVIEFADGVVLSPSNIFDMIETSGDDTFYNWSTSATYTLRAGQGDDTLINNSTQSSDIDRLQFEQGVTVDDIYSTYNGADLVIGFKNAEGTFTIVDDGNDGFLANAHHLDEYIFSDGTTLTREEFLKATLGTAGNDAFDFSGVNDALTLRAGQGDDTLTSNSGTVPDTDTLYFEDGVTVDDIYTVYDGANLVIGFRSASGTLTVIDDASDSSLADRYQIDQYAFSDGTTFNRLDFLKATLGTDGDDAFTGSSADDFFVMRAGQGNDTLTSNGRFDTDTLYFEDGVSVDDIYTVYDGANLVIGFRNAEGTFTVINDASDSSLADRYQVDQYAFSDGTTLNRLDFLKATGGTAGNDTFNGSYANDAFIARAGQGNDTLINYGRFDTDTLYFEDGVTVDDIYTVYDGANLVIGFRNAEGTFTVINDASDSSLADRYQVDQYAFSDGTTLNRLDFLKATGGTAGDDTFNGSYANDAFIARAGQGNDTLVNYGRFDTDTLYFEDGITADDIYTVYDGANLVIGFNNASGTFTVINDASDSSLAGRYQVDQYAFSDGTTLNRLDFLKATAGTAGDDTFNGSYANDAFVIRAGQGNDTLVNYGRFDTDTLYFEDGVTADDIYSYHDGANLVIGFKSAEGTFTIINDASTSSLVDRYQIDQYAFSDGTTLNRADFLTATEQSAPPVSNVIVEDIEMIGTTLQVSDQGHYVIDNSGADVILSLNGENMGPGSLSGWQAIHARSTADGGYKVLWEHTNGWNAEWTLNALGQHVSGVDISNVADLEVLYGADINGDDQILGHAGADMFIFSDGYENNTIVGFEDDIDTLQLSSYLGVTDVASALTHATQVGDDVQFDFGDNDVLLVTNTTLADLQDDITII